MSQAIKQEAAVIINEIYSDLEAACAEMGESLDAESLADSVGDRMYDNSEEYRSMPYPQRRALVLGPRADRVDLHRCWHEW